MTTHHLRKKSLFFKLISLLIVAAFSVTSFLPPAYAQTVFNLPMPGTMITPSADFFPATMAGITIHPDNPLRLDFIITHGDDNLQGEAFKKESQKLINYFFASLTVPDDEMWVNLSPYESDRIIADGLGTTEMGRDMLVQDYMLKQLTASLMYPEEELGAEFWKRIYAKSKARFGTTDIPTDTFNKVWIVPEEAVVYVNGTNVLIGENHLNVMLEQDYLALEQNQDSTKHGVGDVTKDDLDVMSEETKQIIREVILPEIEREVNEGKIFANLRQMYHTMILAAWYKKNLKESIIGKTYMNQNKISGIDLEDKQVKEKVYNQYIAAFQKGVYDYVREDYDPVAKKMIPRKYFSGGLTGDPAVRAEDGALPATVTQSPAVRASMPNGNGASIVATQYNPIDIKGQVVESKDGDEAMISKNEQRISETRPLAISRRNFLRMAAIAGASVMFPSLLYGQPKNNLSPMLAWLRSNVFPDGMPRSYETPDDWRLIGALDNAGVTERMIINDGMSIYDAAAWKTALAASGSPINVQAGDVLTETLSSGRWGGLADIRGWKPQFFTYRGLKLDKNEALFFRLISRNWKQTDPLTGKSEFSGFGQVSYNNDLIVWSDWKPIMGENAWMMIGEIQGAFAKDKERVSVHSNEFKLANSIMPALRALQSTIGAVYHAPEGTTDKDPDDISMENNESLYAALDMMYAVSQDNEYLKMRKSIESYAANQGYDREGKVFYQGGMNHDTGFEPNDTFAVDVQTWGILAFTPSKIDEWHGEGAAYQMWQETKKRGGYFEDGVLRGVGYADHRYDYINEPNDVLSGEWTAGAVAAALELAVYYKDSHPDWSKQALQDAISMRIGLESLAQVDAQGRKSYLYANKRYLVPFGKDDEGWWANSIPSTASTAWVYFIDKGFNPFKLGGATQWFEFKEYAKTVRDIGEGKIKPRTLTKKTSPQPKRSADVDLMALGVYDENGGDKRWKSKASWFDFEPAVSLRTGQKITITYSLVGSDVLGIQLVKDSPNAENREGDMQKFDGVEGRNKTLTITVPSNRKMKRMTFQFGPNAWGRLGGAMDAELEIHSIQLGDKAMLSGDEAMISTAAFTKARDWVLSQFGIGSRAVGEHAVAVNGETLSSIADEYGMSLERIGELNEGKNLSDSLQEGEIIKIDLKFLEAQRQAFQIAINESNENVLNIIQRLMNDENFILLKNEGLAFAIFQRRLAHVPGGVDEFSDYSDKGYDYGTNGDISLLRKKLQRVGAPQMISDRIIDIKEAEAAKTVVSKKEAKQEVAVFKEFIDKANAAFLALLERIMDEENPIFSEQEEWPLAFFRRSLTHIPANIPSLLSPRFDKGYDYGSSDTIAQLRVRLWRVKAKGMMAERRKKLEAERITNGGIDFNPGMMDLSEQGQTIEFSIDNAMMSIPADAVDGMLPVIINITPITNFAPLLGRAREDEGALEEQLLSS